jgi:hypothetical protein
VWVCVCVCCLRVLMDGLVGNECLEPFFWLLCVSSTFVSYLPARFEFFLTSSFVAASVCSCVRVLTCTHMHTHASSCVDPFMISTITYDHHHHYTTGAGEVRPLGAIPERSQRHSPVPNFRPRVARRPVPRRELQNMYTGERESEGKTHIHALTFGTSRVLCDITWTLRLH